MKTPSKYLAAICALAFGLAACGGGGGSSTASSVVTPVVLSGTAAVGTPIVGGVVGVICSNGVSSTSLPTDANGQWTSSLTAPVFPCAVQITKGTINGVANTTSYTSLALVAGIVNISPLTDVMVANAAAAVSTNAWFVSLASKPTGLNSFNSSSMSSALAVLITKLNFVQLNSAGNPITTVFVPVSGNVIDDVLTAFAAAINSANIIYSSFINQIASPNFVVPAGFTAGYAKAYAITKSGISSGAGTINPSQGSNTTIGTAVNGTPALALTECSPYLGVSVFYKCSANAIANFGPKTLKDTVSGSYCTVTYSNGVITVGNGTDVLTGYFGSSVNGFNTIFTSAATPSIITEMGSLNNNQNILGIFSAQWDSSGKITSISGEVIDLVSGVDKNIACYL